MKRLIATFLSLAMVLSLAACGSKETNKPGNVSGSQSSATDGKRTDLKLTIYSAVFDDETQGICERFQEETGIQTSNVVLGGGEILARVQAEKDNPTASVWFGGPADPFISAKEQGLLLQYESPNSADIDAK